MAVFAPVFLQAFFLFVAAQQRFVFRLFQRKFRRYVAHITTAIELRHLDTTDLNIII
tara:strand:- start:13180 stop:13350 length:171 start_codon:yes stop_codon:yes gene_type:complete